jgi:hypothetical protein
VAEVDESEWVSDDGVADLRAMADGLRARAAARQATIDELERMGPELIDRLAGPVAALRRIGGLPPKDLHVLVEERRCN